MKSAGWDNELGMYRTRFNSFKSIARGLSGSEDQEKVKKRSSTRKYICPQCGLSVRATKVVKIACIDCNNIQMIEENVR